MNLTEFQFKVLDDAANEGEVIFAVAEPLPTDALHKAAQYGRQITEVEALLKEGFVREVTNDFQKTVIREQARGRGCRVFALTPMGLLLFQRRTGRTQ